MKSATTMGNPQFAATPGRRSFKNAQFQDFQVEHDFPKIGQKVLLLNARRMAGGTGEDPVSCWQWKTSRSASQADVAPR